MGSLFSSLFENYFAFFLMSSADSQQRIDQFLQWFRDLDSSDQDELMTLVHSEHKVREVVRSFSAMPVDQRKSVFQRLGLPNDLLNRIPPPATCTDSEIDVEWKEWDNSKSS
jgi:hypothetical protein